MGFGFWARHDEMNFLGFFLYIWEVGTCGRDSISFLGHGYTLLRQALQITFGF